MSEKPRVILFSYVPLSDFQSVTDHPGQTIDLNQDNSEQQINQLMEKMFVECPTIEGVLWSLENGFACPIFITRDRAHKLASHMEQWAEYDSTRFTLHLSERGDQYGVMLMPNLKASVDRWVKAQEIFCDNKINPEDYDFNIFFKAVGVVCPDNRAFQKVKPYLAEKTRIGFIDLDEIDPQDLSKTDSMKIRYIGPFDINKEQSDAAEQHFDAWFADMNSGN